MLFQICYCSSGYVYNSTLLECVDHDECEEESCVGGVCVNTVGSYYCSCPPPLVLDDTQRNCVNSSHLTVGKTPRSRLAWQPPPPVCECVCEWVNVIIQCKALWSLLMQMKKRYENLSVCWQQVSADLLCQSPLLGAQVTFTDCCCLYGDGWGMGCALCPPSDSGKHQPESACLCAEDYASLCSSVPLPVSPDLYPDPAGPEAGVRGGAGGGGGELKPGLVAVLRCSPGVRRRTDVGFIRVLLFRTLSAVRSGLLPSCSGSRQRLQPVGL
uniref:Uncharacterized protein n=1 Tax=Salarias fasciatus TaxID=181472 RepID=A0A672H8L1_SALFA